MYTLFVFIVLCLGLCNAFTSVGNVRRTNLLSMIVAGDVAPDFELKNAAGKSFKLSQFKGKKPLVVFFYPADNSPGCTKEVHGKIEKASIDSYTLIHSTLLLPFLRRCALLKSEHQVPSPYHSCITILSLKLYIFFCNCVRFQESWR